MYLCVERRINNLAIYLYIRHVYISIQTAKKTCNCTTMSTDFHKLYFFGILICKHFVTTSFILLLLVIDWRRPLYIKECQQNGHKMSESQWVFIDKSTIKPTEAKFWIKNLPKPTKKGMMYCAVMYCTSLRSHSATIVTAVRFCPTSRTRPVVSLFQ